METDEQLRKRIEALYLGSDVRIATECFDGWDLDVAARNHGLRRVTWVPAEKLEVTSDGCVIQHGDMCPCEGEGTRRNYHVTICRGVEHFHIHNTPSDWEFLEEMAERLRIAATSDAMRRVSDALNAQGLQRLAATLAISGNWAAADAHHCSYCEEPLGPVHTTYIDGLGKRRYCDACWKAEGTVERQAPVSRQRESVAKAIDGINGGLRWPDEAIDMASPEVVELSREAYAVLAHVMLDEQIACGGHDDEEAIRECFRRVEEHFEIVKKLEQDLETLNDLGPEFRMTDADHRGATWERQYQEAEDALERWIHENDGPSF